MKITGIQAAIEAERAVTQNPPILYEHEDCQRFVKNTVLRAGGEIDEYTGSNDMYRNACSEIVPLAIAKLSPGMVLFIVKHDDGEPAKYKADGLGNASHIGWYTGGMYAVVHSSATRGQVAASTLKNSWTHAGYLKALTYNSAGEPVKPDPPQGTAYINLPADKNVFHRISPKTSSPWWGRINGQEMVDVISVSGEWTRVKWGGHDGYVANDFITFTAPAEPAQIDDDEPRGDQILIGELVGLKTQINAKLDELIAAARKVAGA